MNYGNYTYLEIKEKIDLGYGIIVPTGCTEQQGPHLTVDFDTWFAEELLNDVVKESHVKCLVAPVTPYGTAFEHVNFGTGYVDLPQHVFEDLLFYTLKSYYQQGFRKLFIWRGCGGHQVDQMLERFKEDHSDAFVYNLHHPFYDVWCELMDKDIPSGHSDSFTTSVAMYKHPEKVRIDLISNPNSLEPEWLDPNLDFSKYSRTGVIGDPTHASPELGEKLYKRTVEKVALVLKELMV